MEYYELDDLLKNENELKDKLEDGFICKTITVKELYSIINSFPGWDGIALISKSFKPLPIDDVDSFFADEDVEFNDNDELIKGSDEINCQFCFDYFGESGLVCAETEEIHESEKLLVIFPVDYYNKVFKN